MVFVVGLTATACPPRAEASTGTFRRGATGFYELRLLENPTCFWRTLRWQATGANPFTDDCAARASHATEAARARAAQGDVYGKCRLREADEPSDSRVIRDRAWTSPIWIEPSATSDAQALATERPAGIVARAMSTLRRWLAASLLGLALLPGLEQSLLAHGHASAGPAAAVSAAPGPEATGPLEDCAACQARASLGSLAVDGHPERHGAAPPAPLLALSERSPAAPRLETPYVRGPPLRIV